MSWCAAPVVTAGLLIIVQTGARYGLDCGPGRGWARNRRRARPLC